MGLSLAVGCSSFEKEDLDTLSQALKDANLKEHNEPVLEDVSCFSADMFGYSGLHYVRRLAAYLAQGDLVPGLGTDEASDDPAVKKYYSRVHPAQPGILGRLLGTKQTPEKLSFQHLMLHSDAEGFYVPQDFEEVLFPRDELNIAGGMIGSSQRLVEECRRLVAWLEIPEDLDYDAEELWEVADTPIKNGAMWQLYGRESFGALRLLRAVEFSVSSGAVLVFC